MCRILAFVADEPVDASPWIDAFAEACRISKEYQGHGWGMAWRTDDGWSRYRTTRPIWEDDAEAPLGRVVVVHARSAFRNEGITEENNMPFLSGDLAFAFNGELRGVRLSVPGETGAARLLHLLDRFRASDAADVPAALRRLDAVIRARTEYVRALNLVVSDGRALHVHSRYSEDPDYFTLRETRVRLRTQAWPSLRAVCSEEIAVEGLKPEWTPIPNGTTRSVALEGSCCS